MKLLDKSIYNFSSYKAYFKAWMAAQPRKGRGLIVALADYLKVNSTFISQILSGASAAKHFSLEQAHEVTEFMGLSGLEKDFFLLLVQYERAGSHKLEKYYQRKIQELKVRSQEIGERLHKERVLSEEEQSVFYSSWIYTALRLYCSIGNGKSFEDLKQYFRLPTEELLKLTEFLTNTGLLISNNGLFQMGSQSTHITRASPHAKRHHMNWRLKSLQNFDRISAQELVFSGPMSLSQKDFQDIREDLVQMISQISKKVADSPSEKVACLNIDLFDVKT